jgi:hypothetical protein
VNQCFVTLWHQHDVLLFWHLAYASLYVITIILTHSCLQTNISNEE